jgi:glycosyltransferase involved in cell wall biosynthesis
VAAFKGRRAGIVSTRLAGTDGVSLETAKWTAVLERLGVTCFYFAGELDRPADSSRLVPEAFYRHPEIEAITRTVFGGIFEGSDEAWDPDSANWADLRRLDFFSPYVRPPQLTRRIDALRAHLLDELNAFAASFDLDLLIVENALAIPLNIPLGLALASFIAETGMPVIAHHHDLPWERQRFAVNSVADYIAAAFPPPLPSVRHVVINSVQAQQLAWRRGLASHVIPNVMDFDTPPEPLDEYAWNARRDLGVEESEALILQPTRIIQRKGIEHAIELVARIGIPARLVITHAGGEEDDGYEERVREFAHLLNVPVRFEADLVGPQRGTTEDGRRTYALADVYPQADLVTYPSSIEGFGNAFLEAVYYRCPIVLNRYSVYETDIGPKGFRAVEFNSFISRDTIRGARRLIAEKTLAAEWAEHNYELARRHFSYTVLQRRLESLLSECLAEER